MCTVDIMHISMHIVKPQGASIAKTPNELRQPATRGTGEAARAASALSDG
jgi:hypothetical protein